jgi:purine-nucleoside phosphorylase
LGNEAVIDLYQKVQECVQSLREISDVIPRAGLILGTGLGGIADSIEVRESIEFSRVPHFPSSTVESHSGNLVLGSLSGCDVIAMQGRFHYYEGHPLEVVTFPVRIFKELGAELLIINSAAGGLNPHFQAADIMVITDHLNFIGENPLRGITDERLGERFPDMSRPYDKDLIRLAVESALDLKISLRQGVYVAVSGPSIETPAETRMLRMLGADAVGMSTVPEVIVANQVGLKTLALTAVTNINLPDTMKPVTIENVIANAAEAEPKLTAVVEQVLRRST